jgi:hypothetical protein
MTHLGTHVHVDHLTVCRDIVSIDRARHLFYSRYAKHEVPPLQERKDGAQFSSG